MDDRIRYFSIWSHIGTELVIIVSSLLLFVVLLIRIFSPAAQKFSITGMFFVSLRSIGDFLKCLQYLVPTQEGKIQA